jgi:hypothetical protein
VEIRNEPRSGRSIWIAQRACLQAYRNPSRKAATECSPGRKPWDKKEKRNQVPQGRQKREHFAVNQRDGMLRSRIIARTQAVMRLILESSSAAHSFGELFFSEDKIPTRYDPSPLCEIDHFSLCGLPHNRNHEG